VRAGFKSERARVSGVVSVRAGFKSERGFGCGFGARGV